METKSRPMKHIDFAALRRRTNHQDIDNGGWPSPIEIGKEDHYSLVAQLDTQRMQLISPPPEEMLSLRRVSGSVRIHFANISTKTEMLYSSVDIYSEVTQIPPLTNHKQR